MSKNVTANRQLIAAIERLDLAKVRQALQRGADPNTPVHMYQHPQQRNMYLSALMYAIDTYPIRDRLARLKIVKLLLQAGADPNTVNHHGHTPLMVAVRTGNQYTVQILQALLKAGADINSTCQCTRIDGQSCGNTALVLLVGQILPLEIKVNTVKLLIANGADVNLGYPLGWALPPTSEQEQASQATAQRLSAVLPASFTPSDKKSVPLPPEHVPEVVELLLRAGAAVGEHISSHPWVLAAQAKIAKS